MRRLVALALAVMLVLSSVATADAATVKRTWTARVGKDAVDGTARMQAFTDGTGKLTLQLGRLRANTAYGLRIRAGTCASLGTVRRRSSRR